MSATNLPSAPMQAVDAPEDRTAVAEQSLYRLVKGGVRHVVKRTRAKRWRDASDVEHMERDEEIIEKDAPNMAAVALFLKSRNPKLYTAYEEDDEDLGAYLRQRQLMRARKIQPKPASEEVVDAVEVPKREARPRPGAPMKAVE